MMKNWKIFILVAGILLLAASIIVYEARIISCYPPASTWEQYSSEYRSGLEQTCKYGSSILIQFTPFLSLFIPGIILFSAYWFITRPAIKSRRGGMLNIFLVMIMFDSLLVAMYGLLNYPEPPLFNGPAGWVVETIAGLGFACYVATLALWHWKRWGLILFQGASAALAVFILLGGHSLILAAVIIAGVLGLSLLLRPVRHKLV
jgi:hypothetical protein